MHRYKCENPQCRYSKEGGVILKSPESLEKCPKCGYLVREVPERKINLLQAKRRRHEATLVGMVTVVNGLLKMGHLILPGESYAKLEAAQLALEDELAKFRTRVTKKPGKP